MYTVDITMQPRKTFESGVKAFHYANQSWPISEPENKETTEAKMKELLAKGGIEYKRGLITVLILKDD